MLCTCLYTGTKQDWKLREKKMEFLLQVKIPPCSCTVISTLLPPWQKAARMAKIPPFLELAQVQNTGGANKKAWQDGARKPLSRSSHSLWLSFISSPLGFPPVFSPPFLFPSTGNWKPKAVGADWREVDQALLPSTG